MRKLFLQMLRVSVGASDRLSETPTDQQWLSLLKLADRHALVGVFFYAIQRLPETQRPNQQLYFEWMACTAKIQERNRYMNDKCVEMQRLLSENNFRSAILKGQGNCALYPDKYSRQPGDIDIWVDSTREKTLEYVKKNFQDYYEHRRHIGFKYSDNVEVEIHDQLGAGDDPFTSRKFIKWFSRQSIKDCVPLQLPDNKTITVPNPTVNLFFQLEHIYHHLLTYGIGLRQIMDFYFVLLDANDKNHDFSELRSAIGYAGLGKFVSSLMYVLQMLFGLEEDKMLQQPNQYHGAFLLEDILRSGNFGRSFGSYFRKHGSKAAAFFRRWGYYFRLFWHFPVFAMVRVYCYFKKFFKKSVQHK